jgi:hypothetical protein
MDTKSEKVSFGRYCVILQTSADVASSKASRIASACAFFLRRFGEEVLPTRCLASQDRRSEMPCTHCFFAKCGDETSSAPSVLNCPGGTFRSCHRLSLTQCRTLLLPLPLLILPFACACIR